MTTRRAVRPVRTRVRAVRRDAPDRSALEEAASILRSGGLVAFPTETVYGLGAQALDAEAVSGIFEAKGRPGDNPLIVHVGDEAVVGRVVPRVPPLARRLMERFWPGPLTLVMERDPDVPDVTTAGLDSIAIRMPDHAVARGLLQAAGLPVAAPSANRSGRPSPTTAAHVLADLDGRIDMVLDSGPCPVGLESTVVDVRGPTPVILRPGLITARDIEEAVGAVGVSEDASVHARSPGTRHAHYKPRCHVELFPVDRPADLDRLGRRYTALVDSGARPHVLLSREGVRLWPNSRVQVTVVGGRRDPAEWARKLYGLLRAADDRNDTHLLVEGIPTDGVGAALRDRVRRAAGGR